MNKAEKLYDQVCQTLNHYDLRKVEKYFSHLNKSSNSRDRDYYRETHCQEKYPMGMYYYLGAIVKTVKPKRIVEIGADMGVSALVMASELDENGRVYSLDIRDGWEYVPKEEKRIVKLVGDSLKKELFGDIDLTQVKLWFIDAQHDDIRVSDEIKTYSPYWEKDTIVLFDDLLYYRKTWDSLPYDKFESDQIHGNGFGITVL